jgi:hypothetical protein
MKRIVFAAALILAAASAGAMTIDDYIASLERVQSALADDDIHAARGEARSIIGAEIDHPNGKFHADDALLGAIADAKKIDVRIEPRLATTIAELRRTNPDAKLLDAIAKEQRVAKPRAGGELGVDALTDDRVVNLSNAIEKAFEWIGKKITAFFDWIMRFFPKSKTGNEKSGNIRGVVIGVAVLIAIIVAVLAWIAVRRSRAALPDLVESAAPIASTRDEDPLSRAENEWEVYAAQLAAAGRMREAIRAWYHAVLVALYGAAILHFRKGRTNWEYVATLPPTLPWRRGFIDLTRCFESEWYGASESTREALDDCSRRARAILQSVARTSRGAA